MTKNWTIRPAILDVFDMIVVINLDHRTDRLHEIRQQLDSIGLDFAMPQVVRLSASRFDTPGQFPSIGARGCFDSHMRALELALDTGARSVLVIEDDCDFAGDMNDAAVTLASQDWSFFYGGFCEASAPVGHGGLVEVAPSTGFVGAHCVGFRGQETIAALIRRLQQMAARDGGDPRGGPMHVDGAYGWFRNEHPALRTLIANPSIAVQRSSRSDIANLAWWDRLPGLRQAAQAARRMRRAL